MASTDVMNIISKIFMKYSIQTDAGVNLLTKNELRKYIHKCYPQNTEQSKFINQRCQQILNQYGQSIQNITNRVIQVFYFIFVV